MKAPERILCPVQRAAMALGEEAGKVGDRLSLPAFAQKVAEMSGKTGLSKAVFTVGIFAIGAVANGPGQIWKNVTSRSVDPYNLGGHLADHRVADSKLFGPDGKFSEPAFEHLQSYATEFTKPDGTKELGLSREAVKKFMDDNFARGQDVPAKVRKMMNLEWPPVTDLLARKGASEKYLPVSAVRDLFEKAAFPAEKV